MRRFQARKWSTPHRGVAKKAFARPKICLILSCFGKAFKRSLRLFFILCHDEAKRGGALFSERPAAQKIWSKEKTVKLFLLQHTEAEAKQVTSAKLPHGTRTELFSAAVSLP